MRIWIFTFLALALGSTLSAFRPIATASQDGMADVAIGGYDTVAYFVEGIPVRGSALLQYEWQGARWYFRTQENLRRFRADPARFAPVHGGHCSFCVAASQKVETAGDPTIFFIHGDRLYLLQSEEILTRWQRDPETHIRQADQVYNELLATYNAALAQVTPRVATEG